MTIRRVPGLPGSKIKGHLYHKIEMMTPEKQQMPRTHCYNLLTTLPFLHWFPLMLSYISQWFIKYIHEGEKGPGGWRESSCTWTFGTPLWPWPSAVSPVCCILYLHLSVLCTLWSLWVLSIPHPGSSMQCLTCMASSPLINLQKYLYFHALRL